MGAAWCAKQVLKNEHCSLGFFRARQCAKISKACSITFWGTGREDFHAEKMPPESKEDLYPLLHLYNSKEAVHHLGLTPAGIEVAHKSSRPLPAPLPPSPFHLPPSSCSRGPRSRKRPSPPGRPPSFPSCGNHRYSLAVGRARRGHLASEDFASGTPPANLEARMTKDALQRPAADTGSVCLTLGRGNALFCQAVAFVKGVRALGNRNVTDLPSEFGKSHHRPLRPF